MENYSSKNQEEMLIGRNAIREALRSGREIDSILIALVHEEDHLMIF